MARVIYSAEALADLERIVEFLLENSPDTAATTIERIKSAIAVLADHPEIGRRTDATRRELVISRGNSGYLTLYAFDEYIDVARVLRIRHQREAGYGS